MAKLNAVERSLSGVAPGAKKRTRHSCSPSKTTSEDLAKHSFPTLQSSSMAEHESDDSLDWPTTGPFTYHRWHVMIERWAQCLWSVTIAITNCIWTSTGSQDKSYGAHSVRTNSLAFHSASNTALDLAMTQSGVRAFVSACKSVCVCACTCMLTCCVIGPLRHVGVLQHIGCAVLHPMHAAIAAWRLLHHTFGFAPMHSCFHMLRPCVTGNTMLSTWNGL